MPHSAPRRGLQDIRTSAGRPTSPGSNQRIYMRLCTLEMERARRAQEYRIASERAAVAKSRVDRLQAEIEDLIGMLGGPAAVSSARQRDPAGSMVLEHKYGSGKHRATKGAQS